jgi:hypothetical protein
VGILSDLLHARNPFRSPLDDQEAHEGLVRLLGKVAALLNRHIVTLADTNYMLVGQIDETGAHVTLLQRNESGLASLHERASNCATPTCIRRVSCSAAVVGACWASERQLISSL